jgi:drug/metabolite transporter (DMT)-like permease
VLLTTVSVVLALMAALGNALASVLQRRAAATEPVVSGHGRMAWLAHLPHRPVWLWGSGTLVISGMCQAGALGTGPLAVVQPVMATELPFTLVVGSVFFRRRPSQGAWWAFLAMALGLAAFLFLVEPSGGAASVPDSRWEVAAAPLCLAAAVLLIVAFRLPSAPRATVLGATTAIGFAVTAALMKDAIERLSDGVPALLTAWQTWGVAAVGLTSFLLLQLALRAGTLVASQPALTLGDSLLSVVLGSLLFNEHLTLGLRTIPEAMALAVVVVGSVHLARSPAVSGEPGEQIW